MREIIERVLLDRGEIFASAVIGNHGAFIRFEDVEAVVDRELHAKGRQLAIEPRLIVSTIQSVLVDPPESVRKYLRSLADTYTLFAFMRETPDVQSAIVKIFADGDIWLDTTIVLPLLAETLLDESSRNHSRLIQAANECGLRLYVTEGVIEEVVSHISKSIGYARTSAQSIPHGEAPFLFTTYSLSGRPMVEFTRWLENFCGNRRPEDDVIDYLENEHQIIVENLKADVDDADPVLKAAVSEIWYESREARDQKRASLRLVPEDSLTRSRLVSHDVENYLDVIMRRIKNSERRSAFGYKSWWLTLDQTAFKVQRELGSRINGRPPESPAISMDFMLHYLAIGPVRKRLSRDTEAMLPLMMNMSVLDAVPPALLELADSLRSELAGLPPNVVRRKIRDTLDEARLLLGPMARAGEAALTDEVKKRLLERAAGR